MRRKLHAAAAATCHGKQKNGGPEAAGRLRTGLRPPVLVEPQRLPVNYVVDADVAAASGATCCCCRCILLCFDVCDAAAGGTVMMCLMLLLVVTAIATATGFATATAATYY